MFRTFGRPRRAFASVAFWLAACASGAPAFAGGDAAVAGVVVDAQTGLPVSGAAVRVVAQGNAVTTDTQGAFALDAIVAGTHRLRIERNGYQPTDSEPVTVVDGSTARVTLAIQAAPSASASTLKTIGATSTRATQSLQKSATFYRTLTPETLLATGTFRYGDALRTLPGISNAIAGDTASLGDDLQLNVRGIGTAETTSTLDGHPIGYGVPGGFNYQLSPTFGLQNVTVYYGSAGTDLEGYDAIGGIVDSQTIEPTPDQRLSLSLGAGTYGKMGTNLVATGTLRNRLGYAFSLGVSTLDGPFNNAYLYQPGAAYDPSATDPAVRDLAVYKDDSTATTRSAVGKLRYNLSDATRLTLTSVNSTYWEDKTGNGDGDFLAPPVALAQGQAGLAGKNPSDRCPAGEFTAKNPANGITFGTGPGGVPDGGRPCQTPQSFARYVTGFQGAGPAWQSFDFNDEALHFETRGARHVARLDAFTNRYFDTNDRTFQLPFDSVPGDSGSFSNTNAASAGLEVSENLIGANNEFGFGAEYTNYAYKIQRNGTLRGAPIVHETAEFVREAFHPQHAPIAIYGAAYFKRDTATDSSYVDPRLSVVYTAGGGNDVFRVAAGATTTEPLANELDQLFTPANFVTAGGGGGVSCGATNSIGSAPSSVLRPERGVDEEAAYGHRFEGDSQLQIAFYNTNVFDKIYSTITPLTVTGTGFIDAATLARAEGLVAAACGTSNPLALLGVTGAVNIGQQRAQGLVVSGRQRVDRRLFFDYDYGTTSTVIRSVTPQFLQQNLTDVPGAQVPRLPLHTLNFAADTLLAPKIDLRYTLHAFSDNNTKRLGAYNYSDLRVSASGVGPGTFSIGVFNLWNQDAFIEGYLGEGQPLALNAYAKPSSYAPYFGASATELFGLPYRSVFFTYSLQVR